MRVLVVGLNPSKVGGGTKCGSVKTLFKWLDILELKTISFINLYDDYEVVRSKNQKHEIRQISKDYAKILALGAEVSNNLKNLGVTHFRLPHPSGRNRLLNDKEFVLRVLQDCKEYVKEGKLC